MTAVAGMPQLPSGASPQESIQAASGFGFGELDELEPSEAPSEEELAAMFAALAKCTSVALACRQKEQYGRALTLLQRGLHSCEVLGEQAHPRVALAMAKTRLNIGAILSQCGRHEEAMFEIQQSEDGLANVLQWCDSCDPSDIGVCAIFEEAVALRCMALIASAVEEEHYGPLLATPPMTPKSQEGKDLQPQRVDPCKSLYEEAAALAATCLPPTHPVIPYTRIKRDEYVLKAEAAIVAQIDTADGESNAKVARSQEASRGILPIQVQADPRRWNLLPATRRLEMEGSGGFMLRWRPAKEAPSSPTKSTGSVSPSKGDLDHRRPGALERQRAATQNKTAGPEELLPRLDGEDHRDRERTRPRRNPFVEWTEGDTSKTEERKRRMEDGYQEMFQKRLERHRTSYILEFNRLSTQDLYENRTIYTSSAHSLRTKQLAKNNVSRSMPVLKQDSTARTRKKKKEDENELQSLEAASANQLREQIKQSHRSIQENIPKAQIPWQELGYPKHEDPVIIQQQRLEDKEGKKLRGSLGHVVSHFAVGIGKNKRKNSKVRLSQTLG
jgi:hypothetical protein